MNISTILQKNQAKNRISENFMALQKEIEKPEFQFPYKSIGYDSLIM